MRIASLVLPTCDNAGNYIEDIHASLRADLCDIFGGFSCIHIVGGWKNESGTIQIEPGERYDIAMSDDDESARKLRTIARHYCRLAQQDCVMVTLADGSVEFLKE